MIVSRVLGLKPKEMLNSLVEMSRHALMVSGKVCQGSLVKIPTESKQSNESSDGCERTEIESSIGCEKLLTRFARALTIYERGGIAMLTGVESIRGVTVVIAGGGVVLHDVMYDPVAPPSKKDRINAV